MLNGYYQMNWQEIEDKLIRIITPYLDDSKELVNNWISSLGQNKYLQIFGLSLFLDLDHKHVDLAFFCKVLSDLDETISHPIDNFNYAFKKYAERNKLNIEDFSCLNLHGPQPIDVDDCYLRVVPIESFIKYYLNKIPDPTTIELVINEYFKDSSDGDFSVIQNWGGGPPLCLNWVASFEEMRREFGPLVNKGTIITQRLGLKLMGGQSKSGKPIVVAIKYPTTFSLLAYQPTFIDGFLGVRNETDSLYMSIEDVDSWGKTIPSNGQGDGLKERIHKKIDQLTDGFSGLEIGECEPSYDIDSRCILCYSRIKLTS